jgi:hypothetical protein
MSSDKSLFGALHGKRPRCQPFFPPGPAPHTNDCVGAERWKTVQEEARSDPASAVSSCANPLTACARFGSVPPLG